MYCSISWARGAKSPILTYRPRIMHRNVVFPPMALFVAALVHRTRFKLSRDDVVAQQKWRNGARRLNILACSRCTSLPKLGARKARPYPYKYAPSQNRSKLHVTSAVQSPVIKAPPEGRDAKHGPSGLDWIRHSLGPDSGTRQAVSRPRAEACRAEAIRSGICLQGV